MSAKGDNIHMYLLPGLDSWSIFFLLQDEVSSLLAVIHCTVQDKICQSHLFLAGVEIGVLPNEQHNLGGVFHIVDTKTIAIDDFEYDGGGPGDTN